MAALTGIEPKNLWRNFEGLCSVPHPSKKEEKIIAYIEKWADSNGFEHEKDEVGNLVVRKPATPGMENRLPVCIQGHVDMVCVKNSDTEFDFDTQGIQPYIDGNWVKARGTTLGADNGIGVAMGMTIMDSGDMPHPDIELLCTLDEETGLTGAVGLSPNILKAKVLINLDSEEWGHFTIGCAGGANAMGTFKYEAKPVCNCASDCKSYKLTVKGLRGGHSGIEIHEDRANAVKLMTRLIYDAMEKFDICMTSIDGGDKHNAIPHECFAVVGVKPENEAEFKAFVEKFFAEAKAEYTKREPGMIILAEPCATPSRCMTKEFQTRFIKSLFALPHGVYHWSPDIPGFPQTSVNCAIVKTEKDTIEVLTSQRSSLESEKMDISNKVKVILELGGAVAEIGDGYPSWPPNADSHILSIGKEVYKKIYGKDAVIEAIHAGLECGLVGEKYPGMDMISFGPNLEEVHTANERVDIPSAEKCFHLVGELLKNIPLK
jgi:dipeptidase D